MEYKEIYEYRFNELLNTAKKLSKKINYSDNDNNDMIVDVSGNNFREYKYVLSHSESWAIDTIVKIVKNMFVQSGVEYKKVEYISTEKGNREIRLPISFVLDCNGIKEGYIFDYRNRIPLGKLRDTAKNNTNIQKLHFVYLLKESNENIVRLNSFEDQDDNSFIHFEVFKEFFINKFGKEEYDIFLEYAEKFNEEVKNIIGLRLHSIPTEKMLEGFKQKTINEIRSVDYYSLLEGAEKRLTKNKNSSIFINSSDKSLLYKEYITNERCRLLLSNNIFSHSFLGSEWLYKSNVIIDGAFDITGLATGYLKSIEQLIYSYIRLYIDDYLQERWVYHNIEPDKIKEYIIDGTINSNDIRDGKIRFLSEYEPYFDKTLGPLIKLLKDKDRRDSNFFASSDLFNFEASNIPNLIQFVVNELFSFKDDDRNEYSHQDNMYTKEDLDKVREDALLLYFLLIGSFDIDEEKMIDLGFVIENNNKIINDKELRNELEEWIFPIIRFDFPKDCPVLALSLINREEIWQIDVMGLGETPEEVYQTVKWNYNMVKSPELYGSLEISNLPADWDYSLPKIISSLKSIIYSNSLVGKTLRSYSKILIGTYHVIEVLFEKNKTSVIEL